MTDAKNPTETIVEVVEKLWEAVVDTIESLLRPAPEPVLIPIRKGPRRY